VNTNDHANWREKGVINWARDLGFYMSQKDRRYTMWSLHPPKIVLDQVNLDQVEHYLARYEVAPQAKLPVTKSGDVRLRRKRRTRCKRHFMLSLLIGVMEIVEYGDERPTPITALVAPIMNTATIR